VPSSLLIFNMKMLCDFNLSERRAWLLKNKNKFNIKGEGLKKTSPLKALYGMEDAKVVLEEFCPHCNDVTLADYSTKNNPRRAFAAHQKRCKELFGSLADAVNS